MKKWVIQDWAGNYCYQDKQFDSFDDARDFISELAHKAAEEAKFFDIDSDEYNQIYDGVCEDLYAVEERTVA